MANNTSQERFGGWIPYEEAATDEFSIALDNNIDFQGNMQPQVRSENIPDSVPPHGIQAPGMWTPFETGTEACTFVASKLILLVFKISTDPNQDKQFSETGNCPTPNWTSPCFSATGVVPSFPTNNCLGPEIIAVANSEVAPNYGTCKLLIQEHIMTFLVRTFFYRAAIWNHTNT